MKTNKLILIFGIIFFNFCKAQVPDDPMTFAEYPNFYNQTVNKLDNLIPNKTSYYNQPLSVFLQALVQNNIIVKDYEPAPFSSAKLLKLSFLWNRDVRVDVMDNGYVRPYIAIYFQEPFNFPQATTILNNNYASHWNPTAENFYKNLIIKKIEFWYVRGLTDKSENPK